MPYPELIVDKWIDEKLDALFDFVAYVLMFAMSLCATACMF